MTLGNLLLQILNNRSGGINTNISHDQNLFQFFIKIFINVGKAAENIIKSGYDIVSGLGQSADQSFKKTFLFFCHDSPPVTG